MQSGESPSQTALSWAGISARCPGGSFLEGRASPRSYGRRRRYDVLALLAWTQRAKTITIAITMINADPSFMIPAASC